MDGKTLFSRSSRAGCCGGRAFATSGGGAIWPRGQPGNQLGAAVPDGGQRTQPRRRRSIARTSGRPAKACNELKAFGLQARTTPALGTESRALTALPGGQSGSHCRVLLGSSRRLRTMLRARWRSKRVIRNKSNRETNSELRVKFFPFEMTREGAAGRTTGRGQLRSHGAGPRAREFNRPVPKNRRRFWIAVSLSPRDGRG